MAGDSLGTMTVGVTANVSDAERALNGLANMLERFDRQMQSRGRSGGGRGGTSAGGGYFSPMSEEFQNEIKRMEQVQKRTESALRFREIRRSEEMAANTRNVDEQMRGLGEAFKSGGAAGAEEYLNRTNRAIAQVGDTSARTRYAVLNLGYGIQDAVQVFGTSGLAGAVRASANNLQGLGVLFDKTAGGMKGLTAALMSGEFVVMGIATAVLLAADAWQSYSKSVEEANKKAAAEKFKRMDPLGEVEKAGKEEAQNRELARMEKLADAEKKKKEITDQIAVTNAKINKFNNEELTLKGKIADLAELIAGYDFAMQGGGPDFGNILTKQEEVLVKRMNEMGGRDVAVRDLADLREKLQKLQGEEGKVGTGEELTREKERLQRELDAATKRANELQPDAIQNAKRELDILKQQVQSLDNREKLERDAIKDAQQRLNVIKQEDQLEENARVKRAKYMEAMREAVTRGEQREVKKDKQYRITEDELRAQERSFQRSRDREAVEKKVAAFDASMEKIAADRAAAQKKIASIEQTYPQFSPKEQLLEMQQSDMEYRVSFLNKKRREVEARMRSGDQFTGVAQFESATAYEALARSRMGPAPETDTLRKILVAEEKATAALEDIREKLDPGRRERLVILESFE